MATFGRPPASSLASESAVDAGQAAALPTLDLAATIPVTTNSTGSPGDASPPSVPAPSPAVPAEIDSLPRAATDSTTGGHAHTTWYRWLPLTAADSAEASVFGAGTLTYRPLVALPNWTRGDAAVAGAAIVLFLCSVWLFARGFRLASVAAAPVAVSWVVVAIVGVVCAGVVMTLDRTLLWLLVVGHSFWFFVGGTALLLSIGTHLVEISAGSAQRDPDSLATLVLTSACAACGLAIDAFPNRAVQRPMVRVLLLLVVAQVLFQLVATVLGTTASYSAPCLWSNTVALRQQATFALLIVLLRNMWLLFRSPFLFAMLSVPLHVHEFLGPDPRDRAASLELVESAYQQSWHDMQEVQAMGATAAVNDEATVFWFAPCHHLDFPVPVSHQPLVPGEWLARFWAWPYGPWVLTFAVALVIVWVMAATSHVQQGLIAVLLLAILITTAHQFEANMFLRLLQQGTSSFMYAWFVWLVLGTWVFQVREVVGNEIQYQLLAQRCSETLHQARIFGVSQYTSLMLCSIFSISLVACPKFPRRFVLACDLFFTCMHGYNLYVYLFAFMRAGSPVSVGSTGGTGSSNLEVLTTVNLFLVLNYIYAFPWASLWSTGGHSNARLYRASVARGLDVDTMQRFREHAVRGWQVAAANLFKC